MKKTEKQFFVENLTEELKSAKSAILVNYSGLTVAKQRELKKRLKEVDARFVVVKNTLLARAGESAKYPSEVLSDSVLTGQNALVLAGDDPIKPLKVIADFAKEHELPQIKVGVVEGLFANNDILSNLAKLGGKDAVIAQLVGMLMAPAQQTVGVLEGKIQELIYLIDQVKGKR
ncbi:50S ribosomal protein L10 [Candidatus Woesebacteria bacterium]|nr:50S ribosomal protein L10 [Candidatus Woesebacteria bacterium]